MRQMIEAVDLTKDYGSVTAVNRVSFSVAEGELFGLLGPNGSGKTTMIRMLTGQVRPTAGSARVMGLDVADDPIAVRRLVGIIPEQETPPSFLTAEEYLHFVARIRNLDAVEERCDHWFDLLEFGEKRNVLCKDLSRGTRQKLMFAQAFLHRPRLALIDEPLINLDPIVQRTVKDFLEDYVQDGGTVFLSTHILEIAAEICDRIGVIHNGRLLSCGRTEDLAGSGRSLERFFLDLVRGDAGA
ncbi:MULTISPECIES: ABC transporter ATP-binding protein [Methanoculleus]|uniref:ABC-2 type transport system ATP-binding protein n=1 Tax=Methanoculleus thermophilus TaxID=2200 RepID=A0A1G9A5A8_9EURY|nr:MULTISPECIES: ABC transporter ATP-binding protein [Methanoculleus]SDK21620.1 ABC-2 type transport system ATP-binding protein [Methanoculleus thermophilus]